MINGCPPWRALVSSSIVISLSLTKYHLPLSLVIITFVNFAVSAPYLDLKTASAIVTSIVHSKLDYCNSLYYNLPKSQTNRLQVIQNSLAQDLRLPNSVTSPLFWNLYTGLKSMNTLNTNFFPLRIKLLPQLKLLICTAWSLFSPPCYSLLICSHLLSTTYIFFFKNQQ